MREKAFSSHHVITRISTVLDLALTLLLTYITPPLTTLLSPKLIPLRPKVRWIKPCCYK